MANFFGMKKIITLSLLFGFILLFVMACKNKIDSSPLDDELYAAVRQGGQYYIGTPGITAAAGDSPHGYMRVRCNATAFAALDANGKLPQGGKFPVGSVIVKEVYTSLNGEIKEYAVMRKESNSSLSAGGYVWAEFENDGKVKYSAAEKGEACVSCHQSSNNRDFVRTFDLH